MSDKQYVWWACRACGWVGPSWKMDCSCQSRYGGSYVALRVPPNVVLTERAEQTREARTFSGQPIWYERPEETKIVLVDIRSGLFHEARYAGQLGHHRVSVLEHSVVVTRLCQVDEARPYAAAHDAHEAYVKDIPTGLKQLLPEYRRIEDKWEEHVHRALGLEWPVPPEIRAEVKRADRRAAAVEMTLGGWRPGWAPADRADPPTDAELAVGSAVLQATTSLHGLWGELVDLWPAAR